LTTWTLYENHPYVVIDWGIDGKKPNPLPEAGWLSFPFDLDTPQYRLYRTGGIVDPKRDLVERSNKDFCFLNTSMAMFDESGGGVALNCPASPGISIDNPGLFRFSKVKELTTGTVFVNLYNNQWGTNFAGWIDGSFSSKMYLWSFDEFDAERSFVTPSEETRVLLKGVFHDGRRGNGLVSQAGVSLSRRGILLTALKRQEKGMLLRLWEQTGTGGPCAVTLPQGSAFTVACPCDLRGGRTCANGIEISGGTFEFTARPNQPATFILK
jgi:hypothetical protein